MPGDPRMRASDADRERTATLLREHHAEGRLTAEEFSERVDRVFAAKTLGELDALLADLPGIDLYRLPAAGIRPAPPGARRPRSREGAIDRRSAGAVSPQRLTNWAAWAAISALLFVAWLGLGLVSGGAAWVPWFLLVVVPWGMVIARRPPDHP
jgi:Domain of unknown function (DUF1707)